MKKEQRINNQLATNMITAEKLNELSRKAFKDSEAHGYDMSPAKAGWWLLVATGEVAEVVEAYRNDRRADSAKIETFKTNTSAYHDGAKDWIQAKMNYNRARPYLHGRYNDKYSKKL